MKNIVFVTNSISFGGAAKMLCFVAESLAKRKYSVLIINLHSTVNTSGFEREIDKAVSVYRVADVPAGENKNVFRIKEIIRAAKAFGAEVLIGFTNYPNMYAKIAGTVLGIPSVMSERGDPSRTMGKGLHSKLAKWIIDRSKGGVFQTDGAMEYYGNGLKKRGMVIPNPIFIKGEVPNISFAEREKSVVSVGRLDNEQKRYDIMLKAFKIFSEKHSDYVLKLYGMGEDEEKIRSWADELAISDKVLFMGLTKQAMQDMAPCGMFLITSDYEGISNSLLEAMAVGLPCVSTDHTPGGARLLIQDGENGLLAPTGDFHALADAMCRFAENPELAEKCGVKAKEVVSRFEPKKIIDMWENYVKMVCKEGV